VTKENETSAGLARAGPRARRHRGAARRQERFLRKGCALGARPRRSSGKSACETFSQLAEDAPEHGATPSARSRDADRL